MNNNFNNNFLDALDDCDVSDGLVDWADDIHKVLDKCAIILIFTNRNIQAQQASSTRLYKCEENKCVLVYVVAMLCYVLS
jgi:hypothetical protein